MAKGDDKRSRNAIDYRGNMAQQGQENLGVGLQARQDENVPRYNTAANEAMGDYRNIMDQYRNFQTTGLTPVTADKVTYNRSPEMEEAFGGYRNFMNTGGFSDADLGALRARGISPIRAVYANTMNDMRRQRALQGGYSPNFNAAATRMSSQLGQSIADQVQNVNAGIAEMVQKGKMFGTEGMGGLSVQDTNFGQNAQLANQAANLRAGEINRTTTDPLRLAAIEGQSRLFGTAPGMAGQFGNQASQSTQDLINAQQMQNSLGLNLIGQQISAGQLPGRWDSTVGRIGQIANIGAGIAAPFMTGGINMLGNGSGMGSVYTNPNILRQQYPQAPAGYRG